MPKKSILHEILEILYNLTIGIFKGLQDQAVETLEIQLLDMEAAFLTLIFGSLVGLPILPIGLAAELAPYVKDEIKILEKRHFLGADVLAEYFSSLGGEW